MFGHFENFSGPENVKWLLSFIKVIERTFIIKQFCFHEIRLYKMKQARSNFL